MQIDSTMKTTYPNIIVRRKPNTEELATPGGLIWTPGVKMCDERECLVLATYGGRTLTHADGTITEEHCEVEPGDTVWVYNFDGEELDSSDPYLQKVLIENVHAVLKRIPEDD